MTQFEYVMADKRLDTLKTKKALLEFIREIHGLITVSSSRHQTTYCYITDFGALSCLNRIFTKAIRLYSGNTPLFIMSTRHNIYSQVLLQAIAQNIPDAEVRLALCDEDVLIGEDINYDDLRGFLSSAMTYHSRLSLKAKLQILSIVRDSCEPSTIHNTNS